MKYDDNHAALGGKRSGAEVNVAVWLDQHEIPYEYEKHKLPYTSSVKGGVCPNCGTAAVQNRVYTPDFWFPEQKFFLEVKGRLDSETRKKMRDVKRCHPKSDIRFLFTANNKIVPSKPERYSDWAEKYGFTYCLRSIDAKWFT